MHQLSSGDNLYAMKINHYSKEDETLATLLNLDGEIFPMDSGYWTKFEAYRVNPEPHIPHGVRYSLTLHDRHNHGARKITWDHKHKRDTISPYEYESASQLLEDFWREVERIMGQKGKVEK